MRDRSTSMLFSSLPTFIITLYPVFSLNLFTNLHITPFRELIAPGPTGLTHVSAPSQTFALHSHLNKLNLIQQHPSNCTGMAASCATCRAACEAGSRLGVVAPPAHPSRGPAQEPAGRRARAPAHVLHRPLLRLVSLTASRRLAHRNPTSASLRASRRLIAPPHRAA